jgi:hypothetical protein
MSDYASTGIMERGISFKQPIEISVYLALAPNSYEFVLNRNTIMFILLMTCDTITGE